MSTEVQSRRRRLADPAPRAGSGARPRQPAFHERALEGSPAVVPPRTIRVQNHKNKTPPRTIACANSSEQNCCSNARTFGTLTAIPVNTIDQRIQMNDYERQPVSTTSVAIGFNGPPSMLATTAAKSSAPLSHHSLGCIGPDIKESESRGGHKCGKGPLPAVRGKPPRFRSYCARGS